MSTGLQHDPIDYDDLAEGRPERYRSLSAWAVGSLVFGLLSILTAFDWIVGLILASLGIFLGLVALQRIDSAPQELTGVRVAKTGMILSAVLWSSGALWQLYLHNLETPSGYHRITYGLLQPDPADKTGEPPPAAQALEGKLVYVKGYMAPGRQNSGISQFALVPVDNTCPYCVPNPGESEMIQVKLSHGIKANYSTRIQGVGGKFHIRSPDDKEKGLLYQIEAYILRQ